MSWKPNMDGDGRGQYSTLEVATHQHDSQKEVVAHSDLPQVVSPREYYKPEQQNGFYAASGGGAPSTYQPTEHTAASPYSTAHYPNGAVAPVPVPPIDEKPEGKRICGIAAKTFWIIVGVAIVLIAGIVGGVVGGIKASQRNNVDSPPATADPNAPGAGNSTNPVANLLSPNARVAALNWTDSSRNSYYAVFTQDKYDALIGSFWDSQNVTWTTVNISRALTRIGSPISVKPGTALATAVTGHPGWVFQMNLYFMTPTNGINEVFSKDMTGQVWGVGNVVKESPKVAADNSQLTALWHRCDFGCSNQIYVVFQDKDGKLALMNSTNWAGNFQIDAATRTDPGSGLALIPFITDSGKSNGTNAGELRLYRTDANVMMEHKMSNKRKWEIGATLAKGLSSTPVPVQFAATPFDGWAQILVVRRDPTGTLSTHRWDENSWAERKLIMQGGPVNPNFAYIAMHMENRFYGIIGDTIHEYRWYAGDPNTFIYVGTVGITDKILNP